jgi:alpha-glucoside transport system substrate-binding protein
LDGEDRPDIVMFPQPGRLFEFAERGRIVDLKIFLDDEYLQGQYPQVFLDLASLDGKMIGVWYSVGLKSLVWYPKQAFEAKGYEVPETWDELIALSDQIVADGGAPWCIAINDLDAIGWIGTDWVEDILLRTAPPETYDAWTRHDLPFNSPEIRRVFDIMGQIWLNDDYVYGGVANITTESFLENPAHLFEDPPGCYLHKQASFAPLFFPKGVLYGNDYDFFYLPPIDPELGNPVLGSGDVIAMLNDRPEVREVIRYFTTAESAKVLIEHGGYLSPHKDTPIEWFPTAADLRFAQIVLSADTYRFDGSDLMPAEVGLGSFFRGIYDWVKGHDLETVLQEIDDSWPR